jgi:hypothetical protein
MIRSYALRTSCHFGKLSHFCWIAKFTLTLSIWRNNTKMLILTLYSSCSIMRVRSYWKNSSSDLNRFIQIREKLVRYSFVIDNIQKYSTRLSLRISWTANVYSAELLLLTLSICNYFRLLLVKSNTNTLIRCTSSETNRYNIHTTESLNSFIVCGHNATKHSSKSNRNLLKVLGPSTNIYSILHSN